MYWGEDGRVLDITTGEWIVLPDQPDQRADVFGTTIVAASTDLFVFGGEDWAQSHGEVIGDAYIWHSGRL